MKTREIKVKKLILLGNIVISYDRKHFEKIVKKMN